MSTAQLQSSATILAVDDDRGILNLLESVLQSAGYSVLLAEGGRNAIQIFEDCGTPVHLLLTDVIMPDLTGPVIAERLLERQPNLRVLFMSGFHDAEMVQRFLKTKGFHLLPKPFTVESLLRSVRDVLTVSSGG